MRIHTTVLALISTAFLATPLSAGTDTSTYIGFSLGGAATTNTFGGTNTFGAFSNTDSQFSSEGFASLAFGKHNGITLWGKPFTPEIMVSRSAEFNTVSASFPGLPTPTFFYTSTITVSRLGANLWADLGQAAGMDFEAGGGLGVQQTSFSSTDGVVSTGGKANFTSGYGMVGLRASRALSPSTQLTVAVRFFGSSPISAPLTSIAGGIPGGNLTHGTRDATVSVGIRIVLPK